LSFVLFLLKNCLDKRYHHTERANREKALTKENQHLRTQLSNKIAESQENANAVTAEKEKNNRLEQELATIRAQLQQEQQENSVFQAALVQKEEVIGELGEKLKEAEQTIIRAQTQVQEITDTSEAFINKGNELRMLGWHEEALKAYDRAIEIDPDNFDAYFYKAGTLKKIGEAGEAESLYDQAVSLLPPYGIGSVNRYREIYKEALKVYDKIINIDSIHVHPYLKKIELLIKLGRFKEAVETINAMDEEAGSYVPSSEDAAHVGFAMCKSNTGKEGEGLSLINYAIKLEPRYWLGYYYKGEVLKELGKPDEALVAYDYAISLCGSEDIRRDLKMRKEKLF